jgi:hypothetical protein
MIRVEIVGESTVEIKAEAQRLIDTLDHLATEDRVSKQVIQLRADRPRLLEIAKNAPDDRPTVSIVAPLSGITIADAFSLIEIHNVRVAYIGMNARDYADLRKFGRDILDIETRRDTIKEGLMGCLWGAEIVTDRDFPLGVVTLVDEDFKTFSQITIMR